jgi:hypothetical protein
MVGCCPHLGAGVWTPNDAIHKALTRAIASEQGAAPNGGPVMPFDNSRANEGPPKDEALALLKLAMTTDQWRKAFSKNYPISVDSA